MEQPNKEDYDKVLKQTFNITFESGEEVELVLESSKANPNLNNDTQECFELTFSGPNEKGLVQGTYEMSNETMGTQVMFIVPHGLEGDRVTYGSVFSRVKGS